MSPEELPIGLYQKTTAHFHDGQVISLFVKKKGQGSKVVLLQSPESQLILGGEFVLVLQPVEAAEPPIVGIPPEFPELPTPELPARPFPTFPGVTLPGERPTAPPTTLPGEPSAETPTPLPMPVPPGSEPLPA